PPRPPRDRIRRRTRSADRTAGALMGSEVVAPVQCGCECLLTRKRGATAACEETKALIQARGDLLDRQRRHAPRGELDCEWNAIQLVAYPCYGGRVRFG